MKLDRFRSVLCRAFDDLSDDFFTSDTEQNSPNFFSSLPLSFHTFYALDFDSWMSAIAARRMGDTSLSGLNIQIKCNFQLFPLFLSRKIKIFVRTSARLRERRLCQGEAVGKNEILRNFATGCATVLNKFCNRIFRFLLCISCVDIPEKLKS